MNVKQE